MSDEIRARVSAMMPAARGELAELVALRSVADPRQFPPEECAQAAEWVRGRFAALGFADAGIAVTFTPEQVAEVLGDDGGATCANPNKALSRATLLSLLANGATGPGARPVIADSRAVQGQLLIIEIYCPKQLEDFQKFVDDLKTDDVASD